MSFAKFMTKKPVALIQQESGQGELKRTLTAANLVSLGIGCIIGAGIFVMTGQAAAQYAGPAIILSFVLAGLCCAFAAMCYAELAAMLPVSGSAYSYAYASLGELLAWVMGWLLLLEYGVAASTVAVGWSGYVVSFLAGFGVHIPENLTTPTASMDHATQALVIGSSINLPALLGIVMMTMLLVLGVKESATVNNVIVFVKVAVVILFVAVGIFYVDPANWHPFIPPNTGVDGQYGWSGILRGASIVFFAYVGFEAVSTAAQEAKNPKRDVPIGILGSLFVCTALNMLVSLVLTGLVPFQTLNVPDPIAKAVDAIGLPWLAFLVKIGAIAGLSSVMMVLMYGQTRIFYTMARDGLLPAVFSRVHSRFKTPWVNTLVVGAVIGLVAATTPIDILGDLVSLGTLCAFAIICFSVLYLRRKEPNLPRPFTVPFSPAFPVLGILFCLYLIWALLSNPVTVRFYLFYLIAGLAIYFLYSQRHSRLRNGGEMMGELLEVQGEN
ncbi:MAG: amino acid permease [Pseudomonadota bacterium]|nr:amino acid permease [Pseudomonadota bacterium]